MSLSHAQTDTLPPLPPTVIHFQVSPGSPVRREIALSLIPRLPVPPPHLLKPWLEREIRLGGGGASVLGGGGLRHRCWRRAEGAAAAEADK